MMSSAACHSLRTARIIVCLALGSPLTTTTGAETRLQIYPAGPGGSPERRVELTALNQHLPLRVRRLWHADSKGDRFMEVAVTRCAADGPMTVTLAANGSQLDQPAVRSVGRDLPVKNDGKSLVFELPGPGQYYISLPTLARSNGTFTVTMWVDDLRQLDETRTRLKSAGATDVTARGVRPDPSLDQTAAIQAALDKGGMLVFPPGVYRAGTLRLPSDTTVFLSPGAVLRASDREDAVGNEFIAIENARHVKLFGPGTVDANSLTQRRPHGVRAVNVTSSRDVTVADVLFEESSSWGIHIRKCEDFTARNVKIFSGKDGFDPDASRDVLIEGAFIMSADDSVAVKNRFPDDADGKTTERVTFRNSVVASQKSALKIGTETRGPIRDVTFENCDVFDGERGIVLYARDGGPIERVTWRNLRLFMTNWPQEKESGAVFHLNIERREAATPVRDCVIENVTANWLYRSEFAGLPDAPLDGVTLRNVTVKAGSPKSGKPALFSCRDHVNVKLDGLTVDWQGNEAKWAGVMSGRGLSVSGLRETGRENSRSDTENSKN